MALATYSDLVASVTNWLHRTDLAPQVPDFIRLAESRLNRRLTLRDDEIEVPLTATVGSSYVDLPANYAAPVALWLEAWVPRRTVVFVPPAELPYMPIATYPTYWTVKARCIEFDRLAESNYPLRLRYVAKFELSEDNPTNYLLRNYPDAYLYAALLEAAPYIVDDERLSIWQDRLDRAVGEIQVQEDKSKGIVQLGVEAGLQSRRRTFNFYEG